MKAELRRKVIEKLESLTSERVREKSERIIRKLIGLDLFKKSKNICVYVSKEQEVFTHDLIRSLLGNKNVLVPFIDGSEMKHGKIESFSELEEGRFGVLEPKNKVAAKERTDLIIVPGVAFDRQGNRLGRGKGYYDRFLKDKLILTIGLAFEEQIVEKVPMEEHDVPLNLIITDQQTIRKMAVILDGKETAKKIKTELKEKISQLDEKPCLAVILVGENPASKVYVNMKQIACEKVGMVSKKYTFPVNLQEEELLSLIKELNADAAVNGILVQLPLPKHIDEQKVIKTINPLKDVDGFHPLNVGNLYHGKSKFIPCTPKGVMRILDEYGVELSGKDVAVVGRSNIVGKPLAALMTAKNATVTLCHSRTKSLAEKTLRADVLVAAVGVPKMITADMVKENAVVIDVGVNRVEDLTKEKGYYLCGDVNFDNVKEKVSHITPVPRGIGPMTIAMLMENTYEAYLLQK